MLHASAADGIDDARANPTVEVADELRVRLGQLAERTVEKRHVDPVTGEVLVLRVEPQPVHLAREGLDTRSRPSAPARLFPPRVAGGRRVVGVGADPLGERGEEAGEQRVAGRVETETGRARCEGIDVLGTPDRAAVHGLDLDEAGFAQSLEVETHRVGVDAETVGQLARRQRGGRAGELLVHRKTRFIAQRFQDRQQVHCLDGSGEPGIFSRAPLVLFDVNPLPTSEDVLGVLQGVLDPELHASIVELGMVHDVRIEPNGDVLVKVALTTAGCPLRGQIGTDVRSKVAGLPGVGEVRVEYDEMTQAERSTVMQKARLRASQMAPPTEVPATTRVIAVGSGKGGVGKSSITANLAAALAARGLTVGVLDADIWGFSIPRMLGVTGRLAGVKAKDGKGKITPATVVVPNGGLLKVVSMGLLVDDEDTALMWRGLILARALEQFLVDVAWGDLDYLLIDMPPGTGDIQMALARLLPQTEMLVVTTPAKGAQRVAARVADMARRSYLKVLGVVENMSAFVAPDGSSHAIFGSGGGARLAALTDAPRVGAVPIEAAVSEGGDAGTPVVLAHPETAAAVELTAIAERIVTELLPPVEMAGCTARIMELAQKLA